MEQKNTIDIESEFSLEKIHAKLQEYRSSLCFISDEFIFIEKLLHSYVFEPDTPNLFEKLQLYLSALEKLKKEKEQLKTLLCESEGRIGGAIEGKGSKTDLELYEEYKMMQLKMAKFTLEFQQLKAEIFNYAGGILRKHRPDN
ncbi:hypothetical protein [Eudoraea chungangensis]|uniref:hypothetical protein n=1 Tax=Eudoraea chungangensis TaxID=1481905 RepID=UPI0023ED4057|nr:hypothetical protein [Eudoraea chungangensis]